MSSTEWFRTFMEFVYFLVLYKMVYFVVLYLKVVWPLKKLIAEGKLLAPPAGVTLEYHLCIGAMLLVMGGGTLYGLVHDYPLNPFAVINAPFLLWLVTILHRFRRSYTDRLSAAAAVESEA